MVSGFKQPLNHTPNLDCVHHSNAPLKLNKVVTMIGRNVLVPNDIIDAEVRLKPWMSLNFRPICTIGDHPMRKVR